MSSWFRERGDCFNPYKALSVSTPYYSSPCTRQEVPSKCPLSMGDIGRPISHPSGGVRCKGFFVAIPWICRKPLITPRLLKRSERTISVMFKAVYPLARENKLATMTEDRGMGWLDGPFLVAATAERADLESDLSFVREICRHHHFYCNRLQPIHSIYT